MRKGILGLLAYSLAGLEMAQGQTPNGGYQEPLPIQSPTTRYGAAPYSAYGAARFPGYAAPINAPASFPAFGPMQAVAQEPLPPLPPPTLAPLPNAGGSNNVQADADDPFPSNPSPPVPYGRGSPEPAEPYMVGPVGTWKPAKGYSFYGSADYIFWYVKRQPVPANLSLSLSDPNNVPTLHTEGDSGGRFFVGTWLSDRQDLALEAGYFFLGSGTSNNAQTFPGSAVSNRPIFDGITSESTLLSATTHFMGAEANLRYQACRWDFSGADCPPNRRTSGHLDLLAGFRFADLSESLLLNNTTQFGTAPVLLSNATLATSDSFGTHNHLYAGQIGADVGFGFGRFDINAYTKVALGDNNQTVTINGNTQVSGPPALGNFSSGGGFFAQPGNSGSFHHDSFSVLPEVGANVGFKVCDRCRLAVGYTFIYFSNVVRPGDQLDVSAGSGARPPLFSLGGVRPAPQFTGFNESGFWAQGINLTVEVNY